MAESPKFYPTFKYHPTEAPQGKRFTDEAEFAALSAEWVDTPAKFAAPEDPPVPADPPADVAPRRGRKPKETVQ